eukprot:1304987-Pleurochrysis_carterae.AAC.1
MASAQNALKYLGPPACLDPVAELNGNWEPAQYSLTAERILKLISWHELTARLIKISGGRMVCWLRPLEEVLCIRSNEPCEASSTCDFCALLRSVALPPPPPS